MQGAALVPYRDLALERVVPGRLMLRPRDGRLLAAVRWLGRLLGVAARHAVQAAPCPHARRIWQRSRALDVRPPVAARRVTSRSAVSDDADRSPDAVELAEEMGLFLLGGALADSRIDVRCRAIETIADFGADRAALLLAGLLHDPASAEVRRAAARAAAGSRAEATVFSLLQLLDDFDLEVRRQAKEAIEVITGQRLELDPTASPEARRAHIEWLKQWWKEERLARLLSAELPARRAS